MQLLKNHEGKKQTIEVNGHKIDAVVTIQWDFEYSYPQAGDDFDFGDEKENKTYANRFETGELLNVMISVIARAEGLEGIDHLGCCHVKANHFEADVLETVSTYSMTENALDTLKANILEAVTRLQKYSKGA